MRGDAPSHQPTVQSYRYRTTTKTGAEAVLEEVDLIGSVLGVPKVVLTEASLLSTQFWSERPNASSYKTMAGAAVYLACRIQKQPRLLEEVAEAADRNRRELGRLAREMNRLCTRGTVVDGVRADLVLEPIVANLGLDSELAAKARDILAQWQKLDPLHAHRRPGVQAGAAIYAACILAGTRRTQKEIAGESRCTMQAIRETYATMCRALGFKLRELSPLGLPEEYRSCGWTLVRLLSTRRVHVVGSKHMSTWMSPQPDPMQTLCGCHLPGEFRRVRKESRVTCKGCILQIEKKRGL